MGIMRNILGLGKTVGSIAEVFVPNKTRQLEYDHADFKTVLGQYTAEFQQAHNGWFNRFVNALNRLPRPVLALGTVGLFVFAMVDPVRFALRMDGLAHIPDQLWWLLGAIVSFYFGARELHHMRSTKQPRAKRSVQSPEPAQVAKPVERKRRPAKFQDNAALSEWAETLD